MNQKGTAVSDKCTMHSSLSFPSSGRTKWTPHVSTKVSGETSNGTELERIWVGWQSGCPTYPRASLSH